MNKTEQKAANWLKEQGINARFQARANPDFVAQDGTGYEVKLARGKQGGQIFFTHHQYQELAKMKGPIYVVIYEADSKEPIVFHFDDVKAKNIYPYWVYIAAPSVNVAIDPELHRKVKIRAAETKKTITELVEAALRVLLAKMEAVEKEP